ncbi:hypothetical protein Bbelb_080330 [Branchiostoma belcheri]|nr:hypothetical protein Bbelb_080330 [Branchiostoma belcheri]
MALSSRSRRSLRALANFRSQKERRESGNGAFSNLVNNCRGSTDNLSGSFTSVCSGPFPNTSHYSSRFPTLLYVYVRLVLMFTLHVTPRPTQSLFPRPGDVLSAPRALSTYEKECGKVRHTALPAD